MGGGVVVVRCKRPEDESEVGKDGGACEEEAAAAADLKSAQKKPKPCCGSWGCSWMVPSPMEMGEVGLWAQIQG